MHSYKTYTLTHIFLYLHRQYMSMLYKLQDKNFLEEELNVLHGSKISINGVLVTSMWAEHHGKEHRERCCLFYSRQEAEKEKGAILIEHSKAHPYHLLLQVVPFSWQLP